jgi:hypothetical protein
VAYAYSFAYSATEDDKHWVMVDAAQYKHKDLPAVLIARRALDVLLACAGESQQSSEQEAESGEIEETPSKVDQDEGMEDRADK